MKITELEITNFKAFGETVSIPIRPLTLIFGPNSSGKSSIFQALNLLKQSITESDRYFEGLKPNGSIIELGNYKDFVHDNDEKSDITFSFTIKLDSTSLEYDFRNACVDYNVNWTEDARLHPIINDLIDFLSKFETAKISLVFSNKNIKSIELYINNHTIPVLKFDDENFFSFNYELQSFWFQYWSSVHNCDTKKLSDYIKNTFKKDIFCDEIDINSSDEEKIMKLYSSAINCFKFLFNNQDHYFSKQKCFVPLEFAYFSLHQIIFDGDYSIADEIRFHPAVLLWVMLKNVENFIIYGKYIGPLRDFPKFYYEYSDSSRSYVGNKGENFMDKELFEKALKMPPNERLAFAELILSSLEYEEDEVKFAWINEVKDRINSVNEGQSKLLDFDSLYNED